MGPLVSRAQLEKTTAALESAITEGATIATGGGRPDGDAFQQGYRYAATVLRDIRPEMRVMHDETFGPITPILAIDSLDEAIDVANDSRYGLSAYIFSRGFKESGIGGEDVKGGCCATPRSRPLTTITDSREDPYAGATPTRHERRFGRPWDDSYLDGLPPWDLGRPQPAIVRLADRGAFAGTVLDAGGAALESTGCCWQREATKPSAST